MHTSSTIQPRLTTVDLAARGFSPDQIARLAALAQRYPLSEFLDSNAEWQRLVFLKWRISTHRLHRS